MITKNLASSSLSQQLDQLSFYDFVKPVLVNVKSDHDSETGHFNLDIQVLIISFNFEIPNNFEEIPKQNFRFFSSIVFSDTNRKSE